MYIVHTLFENCALKKRQGDIFICPLEIELINEHFWKSMKALANTPKEEAWLVVVVSTLAIVLEICTYGAIAKKENSTYWRQQLTLCMGNSWKGKHMFQFSLESFMLRFLFFLSQKTNNYAALRGKSTDNRLKGTLSRVSLQWCTKKTKIHGKIQHWDSTAL